MGAFFILEMGFYLWLALVGVVAIGLLLDLRMDGGTILDAKGALLIAIAIGCITTIIGRSVLDWGVIGMATLVAFGGGTISVAIFAGVKKVKDPDWPWPAISVIGGLVALSVAILTCIAVLPMVFGAEYSEEILSVENRSLEPLRGVGSPTVECRANTEEYYFNFAREPGDPMGPHRGILDAERVVLLEDDDPQPSYVEVEIVAMAKTDPLSGRPLNIVYDRHFRPAILYIHQSEIAKSG